MTLPHTISGAALAMALALLALPASARQQAEQNRQDTIRIYDLAPLTVVGRADDLIGTAATASQGYVGARDLSRRPLSREGELLETVPGMILTQHSGSGKSNQMFVRGLNLDHGTDFATRVDGMPVNVVTHAHGQGYTDLNFLVPELVDNIEYSLGTYYADIGDFGAAGGANIQLRRTLDQPFVIGSLGEFGHRRVVAAGSIAVGASGSLLVGGESRGYDGPWVIPEELGKLSGMARYTYESGATRVSVLGMAYDNSWQSSDQIPLRAVEAGEISRFGQIDPTLGGSSSRYSLSGSWTRSSGASSQRIEAYAIRYSLDLFSNFTYLLEDPDAGDQFRQEDDGRLTFGGRVRHRQVVGAAGVEHQLTIGAEVRADQADVTLSRTEDRTVQSIVRSDDVSQLSTGGHVELVSNWTDAFRTTLGLRGDYHTFDVTSDLAANTGTADDAIVSPKLALAWSPSNAVELYLAGGLGFHSNDARGTVTVIDPASGDPAEPVDPLVRSRGAEIGVRATPASGLRTTASLWTLDLDSELLFVGDAGTTEASGASRRVGVSVANFWRLGETWTADLDVSLTRARFQDEAEGQDRVPGAMENVAAAGVSREPVGDGVFGAVRLRRFGSYSLVEDGSIRANSNSLLNLQLGYRLGSARLTLAVFNLLDEEHSDIQYFYASRLAGEPVGGVEDLHFHPAEPRALRVQVSWGF
jgi:outer membrane cobalamin receptor